MRFCSKALQCSSEVLVSSRAACETSEVLIRRMKVVHVAKWRIPLRLPLLAGTNFSILVVCCVWQVLILALFND